MKKKKITIGQNTSRKDNLYPIKKESLQERIHKHDPKNITIVVDKSQAYWQFVSIPKK